jgi:dimethylsulfone monooxygenase
MHTTSKIEELRRATNPLFNDRKLKLGTFCTNLNGGCAISTIPETLEITWPNTMRLAQIADMMEFEALVPVGRWKGFGGVTNFNGAGFECFSWAAGIGAVTKYPAVFATSHVPMYHPVLAAKQATVIDHICNGRHAIPASLHMCSGCCWCLNKAFVHFSTASFSVIRCLPAVLPLKFPLGAL